MGETDINRKIQRIRDSYRRSLPQRLWEVRDCWEAFILGREHSLREGLYHQLHQLAGSAQTFGLPAVSSAARVCLNELKPLLEEQDTGLSKESRRICEDSLEQIADELWQAGTPGDFDPLASQWDTSPPERTRPAPLLTLFCLPGDAALEDLARSLEQKDYRVRVETSLPAKPAEAPGSSPFILLDLNLIDPGHETEPAGLWQGRPVAALAGTDDIAPRLHAVRAGANVLFARPFDIAEITLWLDNYTGNCADDGRILLLTGADARLPGIDTFLAHGGFQVRTISILDELLPVIAGFRPELILIDGPKTETRTSEIAAAIKIDPGNLTLPIVTVCGRGERAVIGPGHDCVAVPARNARELLPAIREQLCRGRMFRSMMTRDSLSRLLNHAECQHQLRLAVLRAKRSGLPLCVAMVDIDHFRQINDLHGHACGDRILKNTARLIAGTLRRTDIIGRHGGEAFLLVLPDTAPDDARVIAEKLRKQYAAYQHDSGDRVLQVTLSIGLSAYPARQSDRSLLKAADDALYRAKSQGRNRLCMADADDQQEAAGDSLIR